MAIEKELLDNLFTNYNYQKPEDLLGENGLLKQLTNATVGQCCPVVIEVKCAA